MRVHVPSAIIALLIALVFGGTLQPTPTFAQYASLVIDSNSGAVLHEDNADAMTYPASLTKMMTLYMLFEALEQKRISMDQRLFASEHAAAQSPTKLGLRPGHSISVETAILAIVTKSANDAAVVVAEALGGSEPAFAAMMTAKAQRLGMWRTTFRNASGLPDNDQITCARDMAKLGLALLRDFPQYYGYFSSTHFSYGGSRLHNHNRLLGQYDGLDGIKTGYIRASGFNLVASAERDGRRLIGVVLGGRTADQRNRRMVNILDDSFEKVGVTVVRDARFAMPSVTAAAASADIQRTNASVREAGVRPGQSASVRARGKARDSREAAASPCSARKSAQGACKVANAGAEAARPATVVKPATSAAKPEQASTRTSKERVSFTSAKDVAVISPAETRREKRKRADN